MIRLTGDHGYKYVAPEHIANIRLSDKKGYTRVYLSGFMKEYLLVTESPEEVARKVLEYKLTMKRLEIYMQSLTVLVDAERIKLFGKEALEARETLQSLAGLEVEHG